MLESKKELAENVIGSGSEKWITESVSYTHLKDFDEHESRKETEAFSKLVDEIIDYNKTEGDNMLSYVEDGADDVYSDVYKRQVEYRPK